MSSHTGCDVAIVGAGPVGLATAIEATSHGFTAHVFERRSGVIDKACGEGLMPAGVEWLRRHRVHLRLSSSDGARFRGIRYLDSSGVVAEGLLPGIGGLGIRRTALSRELRRVAEEKGVVLHERCAVRGFLRDATGVSLETEAGYFEARLLVGADGLHSFVRREAGLELSAHGPRRFGMRRHFAIRPWSDFVEVSFSGDAEAYVTPVGGQCVGVAFLWDADALPDENYESLLARFPALKERLSGAEPSSLVQGAGPLRQAARSCVADRLVLIGDAAGYVDAISGEGLTLGFLSAAALGDRLRWILAAGASADALHSYETEWRRAFSRYAFLSNALLAIAKRPRLRGALLKVLERSPALFDAALAEAMTA